MFSILNYALSKSSAAAGSQAEIDLSDYALKTDLDDYALLSALSAYAKKDEIKAYMPFNQNWRAASTIANFCYDVDHDNDAVEGMTFLGELRCSDFRTKGVPLSNGEAVVEIVKEDGIGGGKTIHIILTSGTTYPYRWEYTYWGHGNNQHGWTGYYPIEDGKIPASAFTSEVQNLLDDTPKEELLIESVSPDSTKVYAITVNDSGVLSATEIATNEKFLTNDYARFYTKDGRRFKVTLENE